MPIPDDAHYINNRRQVRLGDGRIVSRNTAENLFAQQFGFGTNYQLKRGSRELYSRTRGRGSRSVSGPGSGISYEEGLQLARENGTSEKEYRYTAMRVALESEGLRDKSPSGPLARWLTAMGLRNPGWDFSVGETPSADS